MEECLIQITIKENDAEAKRDIHISVGIEDYLDKNIRIIMQLIDLMLNEIVEMQKDSQK